LRSTALLHLLVSLVLSNCARHYQGQKSAHFDGSRFFHQFGDSEKSIYDLMRWRFGGTAADWPEQIAVGEAQHIVPASSPSDIVVTFLNHASAYIQHQGIRVITDPQWSERASPVSFAGPKRVRPPGIAIDQLGGLDVVLISHNHYDHFDLPTLKRLKELYDPHFYVPLGDAYLLESIGISKFTEVDWWDNHKLNSDLTLHFVPVRHWSARSLFDRNKSLWGGFVLDSKDKKIFFAGDTGYCDIFKDIATKFGAFDLSLIPIGAYEPRWFMKNSHLNPEEAVAVHTDLKSKHSLGIHYGFWQLTDEAIDAPIVALNAIKKQRELTDDEFFTLGFGESRTIR
jgi:L-ascorbate metabolism protein UlaG (beta-lactamase superfamily)